MGIEQAWVQVKKRLGLRHSITFASVDIRHLASHLRRDIHHSGFNGSRSGEVAISILRQGLNSKICERANDDKRHYNSNGKRGKFVMHERLLEEVLVETFFEAKCGCAHDDDSEN